MLDGKKTTAYKIFYDALDKVAKFTNDDGYDMWKKAVANVGHDTDEIKATDEAYAKLRLL